MKIAVPVLFNEVCTNFKDSEVFAFFNTDDDNKKLKSRRNIPTPTHNASSITQWLFHNGVNIIITKGERYYIENTFKENGMKIIIQPDNLDPQKAVEAYLNRQSSIDIINEH